MLNALFSVENTLNNQILGWLRRWLAQKIPIRLPMLVVAGVLLLSATLPLVVPERRLVLLLGLVPAIGMVLAFAHWPALGLVALVVTSVIVPSPYLPGGLNFAVLLLYLLIGLWLLDMLLGQRDMHLVRSRTLWPLLTMVAVATLAFGLGQLTWFSFAHPAPLDAQVGGLSVFVLAAGAFLLAAHQVRDLRWLQWLTWVFLALGALFIAGWLAPPSVGALIGRIFQLGATSNSMFWTWLVALAFSQAYINKKLHIGWRLALVGLATATLYVAFVMNRDWKSGYLPAATAIAIIIGLQSWRAALAMVMGGPFMAYYLSSQAITTDEYSYATRLDAWKIMIEIIKVNPITGFGPANYYWYTPLYRIRGWAVQFNSHNQYIDIIAQTGALGMASFVWLAGEIGWLGWRLRNRVPAGFAQAYVYGVLGSLGGTLVAAALADWILPFVYNIGLNGFRGSILAWLFLGGLVSIEQMVRRQTQSQQSDDLLQYGGVSHE